MPTYKPRLEPDSSILCTACGKWTISKNWKEAETACEDCGSHSATECPKCGERFDDLSNEILKTKRAIKNSEKRKKL